MSYTVIWLAKAESQLTRLWLEAEDRSIITNAANEIDKQLRRDAINAGESRNYNSRILYIKPVGVRFDVDAMNARVEVIAVWRHPK